MSCTWVNMRARAKDRGLAAFDQGWYGDTPIDLPEGHNVVCHKIIGVLSGP